MNKKVKSVMVISLFFVAVSCLYVPFVYKFDKVFAGYYFFWSPPSRVIQKEVCTGFNKEKLSILESLRKEFYPEEYKERWVKEQLAKPVAMPEEEPWWRHFIKPWKKEMAETSGFPLIVDYSRIFLELIIIAALGGIGVVIFWGKGK